MIGFDQAKLHGALHLWVYRVDPDGNKRLLEEYSGDNLIVTSGLKMITFLLAGYVTPPNTINKIAKVGVGTGTTTPHASDTSLTNQYTKAVDSYRFTADNVVEFTISMDTGDANGMQISEFGLFSGNDILFSRRLQSPVIPKAADIIIEGKWTVSIFQCKEWKFKSVPEIRYNIKTTLSR
jgi:hypothetical protein